MPAARYALPLVAAFVLGACSAETTPEATGSEVATSDDAGATASASPATPVTATPAPSGGAAPPAATPTRATETVEDNPPGDECGASKVASFVSMAATPKVRAEVAAKVGHNRIRWLPPGSVVTMDLRLDRLNVDLDNANVIIKGRCG